MSTLSQWMDANKLTDADLAERVGVSRVQITRIRNGSSGASLKVAAKLVAMTRLPIEAFIRADAA